jgi:hypothetical protein
MPHAGAIVRNPGKSVQSTVIMYQTSQSAFATTLKGEIEMTNTYLKIAAVAIALAPNIAAAQSINGYQIPSATHTSQPAAADQTDLSVPGDGYRIVAVPRTDGQQPAGYAVDPSVPGDGYRIGSVPHQQSTAAVN